MQIRVGICEDEKFTRSTLEAALRFQGVEVAFSVGSAAEAKRSFEKTSPHVMLVDLHLGDGPNGLELARELRKQQPSLGLVFISSYDSPRLMDRMNLGLPAGAQFLNKGSISSVDEILQAIQLAVARRPAPKLAKDSLGGLTDRQTKVLELVAMGCSNQEIADQLSVGEKSIEAVINRITKRLNLAATPGANQRVQMARAYIRAVGGLRESH